MVKKKKVPPALLLAFIKSVFTKIISGRQQTTSVDKDVEQSKLLQISGGNIKQFSHLGKDFGNSSIR